ncbi:MAG TPA: DUF433 domain-containing protein [Isosphaeraceae bacterium]
MGTFDNIPEALRYAVDSLIGRGRKYMINVRGPREIESSRASTIQVVPASFVYETADLGLTIHLPFDPASGTFVELARFLETQGHNLFDEYRFQGIPCFIIRLGSDIELSHRVLLHVLEKVYEYPAVTTFECEVYDEGPADSDGKEPEGPAEAPPLHAERPPLRVDEGGAVRIGNSRVSLDLVVEQHDNGVTPEAMVRAYDTLVLADVHAAIAYYLRHGDEVRAYLKRRAEEAEALRTRIEAECPRVGRETLLARCSAREKDRAPTVQ